MRLKKEEVTISKFRANILKYLRKFENSFNINITSLGKAPLITRLKNLLESNLITTLWLDFYPACNIENLQDNFVITARLNQIFSIFLELRIADSCCYY